MSHDRDFLTGLTDRLLELDDYRIRDQHMDILELIEKRKALQGADIGKSSERAKEVKKPKTGKNHRGDKDRDKELRKARNAVERLEKRLAELEQEEKDLQAKVMKGNLPADQVQAGYEKMGTVAKQIAQVMGEWEAASAQVEELAEEA